MKKNSENYLDKVPQISYGINWNIDENLIVTLEIENKGVTNRIFQKLPNRNNFISELFL